MIRSAGLRKKWLGLLAVILLSTTFLMGDFCEDVLSIPLKVDYTTDDIELSVEFFKAPEIPFDGDFDGELPDGDMDGEIPGAELGEIELGDIEFGFDGDLEFAFEKDGYDLGVQHQTVNFEKKAPAIKKYKNNLLGIFVRSVTYKVTKNNIPGDIPPLYIYLSPKIQGEEGKGGKDTFDWDKAIEEEKFKKWKLDSDSTNVNGLILLGQTDTMIWNLPDFLKDFPTDERRIIRQTGNIDEISDTILSNFKFEVIIVPSDKIVIDLDDTDKVEKLKDLVGHIKIELNFAVVVVAKT